MAFGLTSSLIHEDVVVPLGWKIYSGYGHGRYECERVRGLFYLPQCPLLFIYF